MIFQPPRFLHDGNRVAMRTGVLWLLFGCSSAFAQLKWDQRQIEVHPTLLQTNAAAAFAFRNIGTNAVTIASVKTSKFIAVKVVHESPIKLVNVRSSNDRMIAKLKAKKEGWDYQIEVTPADTTQPVICVPTGGANGIL